MNKKQNKSGLNFFKYLLSLILDFTIVISLTYLIKTVLGQVLIVDYYTLLIILAITNSLYSSVFYYLYRTTPGKLFFGISLVFKSEKIFLAIIIREIGLKLPYFLFFILFLYSYSVSHSFAHISYSITIFFVFIITNLIIVKIFKKSIIDILSFNYYSYSYQKVNKGILFYFKSVLIVLSLYGTVLIINNTSQKSEFSFLGLNLPETFPEYPYNDTNEYIDFLDQQKNATDYIFYLFEKYDIVILCEPSHLEIKNWEFITNLVSDKRFIENVGNVFTEYGFVSQQTMLDSFLNTEYSDDITLDEAASDLTFYKNFGFFNYLKNINSLNSNIHDSLKIRHFFCDMPVYDNFNLFYRDSLMAQVLIDKFNSSISKEKRNKCLLITNFRHAYNFFKSPPFQNQAEYIFAEFPQKTANVLINSYAMTLLQCHYPIHHGKWDLAFDKNQNKPVGFDFKNSPFGNDIFDHYMKSESDIKYQDVFTGFIFTIRLNDWEFYADVPATDESFANNYRKNDHLVSASFLVHTVYSIYNVIPLLLLILYIFASLIITSYYLLKSILFNKKGQET